MFDGFLKPKFYAKCKSYIKVIKTRLETIQKKRKVVQKYFKSDIVEFLRTGLDYNAYGRAEWLLVEQNMSCCYELIDKFCGCVSSHLSTLQKERECPDECKEAISSLIYAAARFADLHELCDLRNLFVQKYGSSFESYTNKEFVERLRRNPPVKDTKMALLQEIAQELSIDWDGKALEQKLYKPPAPLSNEKQKHVSVCNTGGDEFNGRIAYGRKNVADHSRYRMQNSSEDNTITELSSQDSQKTFSSSVGSVSENETQNMRPSQYKYIRKPAKSKSSSGKPSSAALDEKEPNGEPPAQENGKPRSVHRRPLKPPPGREISNSENNVLVNTSSCTIKSEDSREYLNNRHADDSDEEERIADGLLMHSSKKKSPYDAGKAKASTKSPSQYGDEACKIGHPPARSNSVPLETGSEIDLTRRPNRATSLEPDIMLSAASHVHPRLPDFDELAARVAALNGP